MNIPVNVFGKNLMDAGLIISQILSGRNGKAVKLVCAFLTDWEYHIL